VYVIRVGFNAVFVAIYRPGSVHVTRHFNDFNGLLERLATYSSPLIIVGDFSIHVDVADDPQAGMLFDSVQHAQLHTATLLRDKVARQNRATKSQV